MNLKKEIKEIEDIQIGFNISLAEHKINKIIPLVDYIENNFTTKVK